MTSHAHGGGAHSHAVGAGAQRRALWIALVLNGGFLAAEVAGGIAFRSLALLADAAHMLSDVVGLVIALIAQRLQSRPPTERHSFGLQRAEVLGAQANGILLLGAGIWITYEAVQRFASGDNDVVGGGLLVVATLGLAINLGSAVLLSRAQGESLNMRGAFVHMALDAAGSVGAIAAGIGVVVWQAGWVDPAASIAVAGLVVWSAWGLLRATANVLLEGTPRGMKPGQVEAALASDPAIEAVHHLHLWNLASDTPALSAHVVVRDEPTLHEAQAIGDRLKEMLHKAFGVQHATLELECHHCDDPVGHGH